MLNVLITGIGGQGSVLAARILAQAAEQKGWSVRTAETIGMAQRGGIVSSHVRMGNDGEEVFAPLLSDHSADVVIALEPGEAARTLRFLKPDGLLVTTTTGQQPVAAIAGEPYDPGAFVDELRAVVSNVVVVDDEALCAKAGSRKVLNLVMLATAIAASAAGADRNLGLGSAISIDEMKNALEICVKPSFLALNLSAVDTAVSAFRAGR